MGNGPSIFVRTPQEHLEYMWTHNLRLPYSAPPGHVRVYLLPEWTPGKSPLKEPWAALKADFPLEPTGELELRKVRGKWALERCSAIDLERMQPFEGKCKGRLSQLALNVIADENGVVWMYEPTPSEDTISIRADRLHIVRQYDAAVERLLEATLGRISKLLDKSVTGESVSHCIYPPESSDNIALRDSGANNSPPAMQREAINNEVSVRKDVRKADTSKTSTMTIVRQLVFFASLLYLFMSGALGRYAEIGRELAFGW